MKTIVLFSLFFFSLNSFASEAIGFYSKGSLKDANSILDENLSVIKLFQNRSKLYSTDEMHTLIRGSVNFLSSNYPSAEKIQIGDLSGENGGKATRHVSHQNGLDGDFVYMRVNETAQDISNTEWAEDFVSGSNPSANYHKNRNYELLKYISENFNVGRIFVDPVIKKSLCQIAEDSGELNNVRTIAFLRKLRPANHHRTHFHVRLKCPASDTRCKEQASPPVGSGCSQVDLTIFDVEESC